MFDASTLFSLEGRVALVTGGSRGIGKMIATGFIAQGARVYISSRKADACAQTAQELGPNCIALPMDVSTFGGCQALAQAFAEREPGLDILVNNAGAVWHAAFDRFPESGWDKAMDINLKSPFFLTQAFLPALKRSASAKRPAKVINITSIDGLRLTSRDTYSYQASKAALIFMTRRLAAELVKDRINVTSIAPGAFPTELNRVARDDAATLSRTIPSGRVGRAEDIAGAAIYLASSAGDYVIGDTITVDGGVVFASLPGGRED